MMTCCVNTAQEPEGDIRKLLERAVSEQNLQNAYLQVFYYHLKEVVL